MLCHHTALVLDLGRTDVTFRENYSALYLRECDGVWLGAWSHVWHWSSVLSAPLGSRNAAVITATPVAGHPARHGGSSSVRRQGLSLHRCLSAWLKGLRIYL